MRRRAAGAVRVRRVRRRGGGAAGLWGRAGAGGAKCEEGTGGEIEGVFICGGGQATPSPRRPTSMVLETGTDECAHTFIGKCTSDGATPQPAPK